MKMNGIELLARYQRDRSEDAFRDLVRAYGPLVYSVALRRLYSPALAEEATQTVFTRLATSAPRIASEGALAAWLHRTATRVAIDLWRAESRRRAREEEAAAMQTTTDDGEPLWQRIAPELDGALERLGDADRQAVLLRFFKGMSMREVGEAMGTSEVAARVRVGRALERLRGHLASAGAACGTASLAQRLSAMSVQAAPASALAAVFSVCKVAEATGRTAAMGLLARLWSRALKPAPLAVAVLVGLATFGLIVTVYFRTPAKSDTGPSALENKVAVGPQRRGKVPPWKRGVEDIDQLKEELRAMLRRPTSAKPHPPRQLRDLLGRFGDRIHEAAPILIEALGEKDYETQRWAGSGLGQVLEELRMVKSRWPVCAETMELARPVLAPALKFSSTPNILRAQALLIYLPVNLDDPYEAAVGVPLSMGMQNDLVEGLKSTSPRDSMFAHTIAAALAGHFRKQPGDLPVFADAMARQLREGDELQRGLAAFALAAWPGEKPAEMMKELLGAVNSNSHHRWNSAIPALGLLGADALEAVPDLLACCQPDIRFGNYIELAQLAACRIQPGLRSVYSKANDWMKQEEERAATRMGMMAQDWFESNVRSEGDTGTTTMQTLIRSHADPKGMYGVVARQLEENLTKVPEERREFARDLLKQAGEMAAGELVSAKPWLDPRNTAPLSEYSNLIVESKSARRSGEETGYPRFTPGESEVVSLNSLRMEIQALMFETRVGLSDTGVGLDVRAEALLDRFGGITGQNVTPKRFAEMERAVKAFDPDFCQKWRERVLEKFPSLDRMIEVAGQPAR